MKTIFLALLLFVNLKPAVAASSDTDCLRLMEEAAKEKLAAAQGAYSRHEIEVLKSRITLKKVYPEHTYYKAMIWVRGQEGSQHYVVTAFQLPNQNMCQLEDIRRTTGQMQMYTSPDCAQTVSRPATGSSLPRW